MFLHDYLLACEISTVRTQTLIYAIMCCVLGCSVRLPYMALISWWRRTSGHGCWRLTRVRPWHATPASPINSASTSWRTRSKVSQGHSEYFTFCTLKKNFIIFGYMDRFVWWFVCWGLESLFNIWGHFATVPVVLAAVVHWPMCWHTGMPCRRHRTRHPTPSQYTDMGPTCRCPIHWCGTSHWNYPFKCLWSDLIE